MSEIYYIFAFTFIIHISIIILMKTNINYTGNQDVKLRIIEQLVSINDLELLREIDNLIKSTLIQPKLKKMTHKELLKRAEESNQDIMNKLVYSQKEAEKNAKTW